MTPETLFKPYAGYGRFISDTDGRKAQAARRIDMGYYKPLVGLGEARVGSTSSSNPGLSPVCLLCRHGMAPDTLFKLAPNMGEDTSGDINPVSRSCPVPRGGVSGVMDRSRNTDTRDLGCHLSTGQGGV
ncbi:hypothetical protein VTL71DRAFT_15818 [Oculimacula yallundae]|uniref:Uncharacterized protein n=1 Tax=Oculimacula yallundae TaxID=86028 RepID=A0ABR4CDH5_9HELO